jgi:hypothetical protein
MINRLERCKILCGQNSLFSFCNKLRSPCLLLDCESKKEEKKIENGSETERNAE